MSAVQITLDGQVVTLTFDGPAPVGHVVEWDVEGPAHATPMAGDVNAAILTGYAAGSATIWASIAGSDGSAVPAPDDAGDYEVTPLDVTVADDLTISSGSSSKARPSTSPASTLSEGTPGE